MNGSSFWLMKFPEPIGGVSERRKSLQYIILKIKVSAKEVSESKPPSLVLVAES